MSLEKVRIIVKRPKEKAQILEVPKGYRGNVIKQFIGEDNYVEYVRMSSDGLLSLAIDEEGLLKELETNFYLETNTFPIQRMVGVAVFFRVEYVNVFEKEIFDYTLEDLTDEDIEHINKSLDEKYQAELEKIFDKLDNNHFNGFGFRLF